MRAMRLAYDDFLVRDASSTALRCTARLLSIKEEQEGAMGAIRETRFIHVHRVLGFVVEGDLDDVPALVPLGVVAVPLNDVARSPQSWALVRSAVRSYSRGHAANGPADRRHQRRRGRRDPRHPDLPGSLRGVRGWRSATRRHMKLNQVTNEYAYFFQVVDCSPRSSPDVDVRGGPQPGGESPPLDT
jgi:hypothetical protein